MLVLGVALPLFALVAWGFWTQLDHERRDSRDLAHRIARSIAGDLRDSNVRAEAIITRMAARPRVRAGNPADCDTLFPVVDFFPQYLTLQLFTGGGELLCGSEPQPGETAIAREAQLVIRAYLASHSVIPHDPLMVPIRGRWISIMFRPVQSTSQTKLVLTLVQYLDFNIDAYPRGTVVTIVNDENRILARSQDPEKWIGKRGTHPRVPDNRLEGSAEAQGIDGTTRQYGFTGVPDTQWHLFVGIPSVVAKASLRTLIVRATVVGAILGVILIVLSFRLSRTIERPLGALAAAAQRVEDVGYATPVPTNGPREIAFVGEAFNRMVTRRAEAEAELRASKNELEALSFRLLQLQEEERTRIAREIHDELGQRLTALKIDVGGLLQTVSAEGERKPMIERIRRALDETVASVRRIAAELRPPTLDDFGFLAALETDIRSFEQRTGIECDLSLPSTSLVLPPEVETAAYRIVQEALTNVARHANASRVEIRLRIRDHEVLLDVRDDGRGLNGADLHRRGSLGLIGMRERARQIGATLDIQGVDGKGTIVSLRIPVASEVTA
jgi:signal transduction histidine kinase